MKESNLLKIIWGISLVTVLNFGCVTSRTIPEIHNEIQPNPRYEPQTIQSADMLKEIPPAPIYEYQPIHCAAYAVRTARDMFGKNIKYADAWNLVYNNKKVAIIEDDSHLKKLIEDKILTSGMIIGTYYPFSTYQNGIDEQGKKIRYTHIIVFAGTENKEPIFFHQFINTIEKISLGELKNCDLKLIEIIDEK